MINLARFITDSFFGAGQPKKVEKQQDGTFWYGYQGQGIDFPYSTLFEIFKNIPHVRAIIERKASMWSNARFLIQKTDTKEDEVDYTHSLNVVLNDPNKLQSWRQMLYMLSLRKSIAGIAFLYPGFGLSRRPGRLEFIKPIDFDDYEINADRNKNFLAEDDINNIIKEYIFYMANGGTVRYKPSDIMVLRDTFESYIDVTSRITTNLIPIQNIYKALIARGYLAEKKGGVGIISGNAKDTGMSVPMDPTEKQRLEDRVNSHNLQSGKNIMVTDIPLKFQHTIFPTGELKLFEEIVDSFNTLCDSWGMARELFVGDAAYASTRKQAEADTYNNTIVPEWNDLFGVLNKGLNTAQEKIKIVLDIAHIEVLQKSEKESVEVQKAKSDLYIGELEKNLIDEKEYRQLMGYAPK